MAWLWWLLAPVASTLLGGLVLTVRAAAEPGHRLRRLRKDPMAEHRALLDALARHAPQAANAPQASDAQQTNHVPQANHAPQASDAQQASHASQASHAAQPNHRIPEPDSEQLISVRVLDGGHATSTPS
ncbi:MAG TPA: hypothetical protein VFU36_15940 [Jatrophihabitans sp.]|nr:hypothetical protein [Jatrophihabitans sp.]